MCGFAGIINLSGSDIESSNEVSNMASFIAHRGPDESSVFHGGPVVMAFQRLSIIDLETGGQPMSDATGSITCMLNGEIYNYIEIREQLKNNGSIFRTNSDTEVILHLYKQYGIEFVTHLRGMFAIALWDRENRKLFLIRDRLGKKPLFYSINNGELAFASELKGLIGWKNLDKSICPEAFHDYLSFLYVPTPLSILKNVKKVKPAHIISINIRNGNIETSRYWQLNATPNQAKSQEQFSEELESLLKESVQIRLRSDVPVGAFLSGGIDSTIISALAKEFKDDLQTFNIAFPIKSFDESRYARLAASFIKSNHIEEVVDGDTVTPESFLDMIWYMDEPFGDSSFLATYKLSQLARRYVKVCLSGDGGDELFAGYHRYKYFSMLSGSGRLPSFLVNTGRGIANSIYNLTKNRFTHIATDARKVSKALELSTHSREYQIGALLSYFNEESKSFLYNPDWFSHLKDRDSNSLLHRQIMDVPGTDVPLNELLVRDLLTNMVDDTLVKVDRASMACGLEVRSPFLDHKVVEFSMTIPPEYKLLKRKHKLILKRCFEKVLPEVIANRKKQGFEVPFGSWFKKEPWRSMLIDTLSIDRLSTQGILSPSTIIGMRDEFLRDPEGSSYMTSPYIFRHRIWALFVYQCWYNQFMQKSR